MLGIRELEEEVRRLRIQEEKEAETQKVASDKNELWYCEGRVSVRYVLFWQDEQKYYGKFGRSFWRFAKR